MTKFKYTRFNNTPFETHMIAFNLIEANKTVLDFGCATGYFAQKLKKKNCITYGVEINKVAAQKAERFCQKVVVADIQNVSALDLPHNFFDYLLFLDVLEHLNHPDRTLKASKKFLKKDGKVIISVPNVAHVSVRLNLLFGKFGYSDLGILDKDHIKFFTKKSLVDLIKRAGLKITHLDYSADFGQLPCLGRIVKKHGKRWQYLITSWFNTFLAVQFIAVCSR